MRLTLLKPYGYCEGVAFALKQLDKIITNHQGQKIYLIGWLIHNENIMNDVKKQHVIVLDDQTKSRLNLLKSIPNKKNAVVILSAHGTEVEAVTYAKNNFSKCYDLTCKYIYKNITLIKELLKKDNEIIFLGKKNHPETKAILSYSAKIIYIASLNELNKIKFKSDRQYFLLNQTTIPEHFIKESLKQIKFKNLRWLQTTCRATNLRHQNILKLPKDMGLFVIGDPHSNNAQQLITLGKNRNLTIYSGNNIKSFSKLNLKLQKYAITSSTSTSNYDVEQIVNDLLHLYDAKTLKPNMQHKSK